MIMILRNKRINIKSDSIELRVSFGVPDVKSWLRLYADMLTHGREENLAWAKNETHSEQDIRYFLEHHPNIFASYPEKWRIQLSAWGWATAVREKFVEPSATPNGKEQYYLSDSAFVKRGRPKNS